MNDSTTITQLLLQSKLRRPVLPESLVGRPRLLHKLDEGLRRRLWQDHAGQLVA